jgi:outer membrane protein assembly factor BamB
MLDRPPRRLAALGLLTVLAGGCGAEVGAAGDDQMLTGYGPNLRPLPVRPAWRQVLNEGPIYREKPTERAVAAVEPSGQRVAIGTSAGWFSEFTAGGEPLWRIPVPGGVSAHAVFDQGRILTGTDDGELLALEAGTGIRQWSFKAKGAITQAPTISGGLIYLVDDTNTLYAIDRQTGEWRWQYRRDPPAQFSLVGEARPLAAGGRVYAGFSDGTLAALAAEDGAVVWTKDLAPERDRFQDVDASPQLIGDTLFAASAATGLYAMDPRTGDVRWTLPQAGITGLAVYDDSLLASSDRGLLLRVEPHSGKIEWQVRFEGEGAPTAPVVGAGYLAVGTTRGAVYFLEPESGRIIRRFASGYGFSAPPAVSPDGNLYVLSNGGVVYGFLRD